MAQMRFQPPPPREAHRFGDLFGSGGYDSQTQDMINDAVHRIFNFLPTKSDQRALTFVDQGTRALLLPRLYHTVTIDIADYPYNIIAVTNLFDGDNPGRDFIKRVVFDGSNVNDKASPPSGYAHLASLAIENLPLYQLEHFEWPADFALPAVYSLRLINRQDNLKNLALYNDILSTRAANERKATLDVLTELESLRICPDDKNGLRFTSHILKTRRLKEIHVDLRTYTPRQRDIDYNQPQAAESDVCKLLFQHTMPLHRCPIKHQLLLTRLILWKVNLYRSAETWFMVLRPMHLQELELEQCPWAGNLLAVLGRTQPVLTKVKVVHDISDDWPDRAPANKKHGLTFDKALGLFLHDLAESKAKISAPPVRIFEVHLLRAFNYTFFADGALAHHTPGLEILALDFPPRADSLSELPGLVEALDACDPSRLRQLAVPNIVMYDCGSNYGTEPNLKPMATLNPVTLILVEYWAEERVDVRAQERADHALAVLRATHGEKTRLRVVAVNYSGHGGDWAILEYFVKCEVSVLGRKQEVMVSASYDEVKKFEKEVDILAPSPDSLRNGRA